MQNFSHESMCCLLLHDCESNYLCVFLSAGPTKYDVRWHHIKFWEIIFDIINMELFTKYSKENSQHLPYRATLSAVFQQ